MKKRANISEEEFEEALNVRLGQLRRLGYVYKDGHRSRMSDYNKNHFIPEL